MTTATDREVSQWIAGNLEITLDQVSREDGEMWHRLAEEDTWAFIRLAEQGYRLRRTEEIMPLPLTRLEMDAFLLEFRIKVQMLHDQIPDVPRVQFFFLAGKAFYSSLAFQRIELLYNYLGGLV